MADQTEEGHEYGGYDEDTEDQCAQVPKQLGGVGDEQLDRIHNHAGIYGSLVECPEGEGG